MRRQAGGLALACALVLAGSALASTPSGYRAQATTICKSTSKHLDALTKPTKKSEVNTYFKAALPIFSTQWKALKKLDPPKSYRYLHLKIIGLEKQQIDGVAKLIDVIDGGADPEKAFNALDKTLGPVGDAETAAWDKLHVPACASV